MTASGYERAPYGRQRRDEEWSPYTVRPVDQWDGGKKRRRSNDGPLSPEPRPPTPTYYDRPALKASHYRFLIITYFFAGGLAGAAQVIATIADLFGKQQDRTTVRAGRYLALAGATISPVLLIADLHTKQRWFNMLRIFRRTSPMSIGSWTLSVFGTFSALAAMAQALDDVFGVAAGRVFARWFGVPAALAGIVMSYYTGILLSATSTPVWASAYRLLPALFGASAAASATAALSLTLTATNAPEPARRRVERLALAAGVVELALSLLTERRWRRDGLAAPLDEPRLALAQRGGAQAAGMIVPGLVHLFHLTTGRESRVTSALAAVFTLIGAYCLRTVVVLAGNESAHRSGDSLRFAGADGNGNGRVE